MPIMQTIFLVIIVVIIIQGISQTQRIRFGNWIRRTKASVGISCPAWNIENIIWISTIVKIKNCLYHTRQNMPHILVYNLEHHSKMEPVMKYHWKIFGYNAVVSSYLVWWWWRVVGVRTVIWRGWCIIRRVSVVQLVVRNGGCSIEVLTWNN